MTIAKIATALAFVAGSLASGSATAQHAYLLAGVGRGHIDTACRQVVSCDKRGTVSRVVAGFDVGTGIALELGYVDYGRAREVGAAGLTSDTEVSAAQFGVAWQVPLEAGWGLNLRMGMAHVTTRMTRGGSVDRDHEPQPYAGGGLNYAFTPHLRAELDIDFSGAVLHADKWAVRAVMLGLRADF